MQLLLCKLYLSYNKSTNHFWTSFSVKVMNYINSATNLYLSYVTEQIFNNPDMASVPEHKRLFFSQDLQWRKKAS